MQEGREAVVGRIEVVGRHREADVRDRDGRGCAVLHDRRPRTERDQLIGDYERDEQDDCGGREDATHAPRVEAGEAHLAGALAFADQQAGDQESGDHEEEIDADEAARYLQARVGERPGVIEDHEKDGDASEPLDVGAEVVLLAGPRRPRLLTREMHPSSSP